MNEYLVKSTYAPDMQTMCIQCTPFVILMRFFAYGAEERLTKTVEPGYG